MKKIVYRIGNSDRIGWLKGVQAKLEQLAAKQHEEMLQLIRESFPREGSVDELDRIIQKAMQERLGCTGEVLRGGGNPVVGPEADGEVVETVLKSGAVGSLDVEERDCEVCDRKGCALYRGERGSVARDCEIGKLLRIHLSGLPGDWIKDPYYSRIITPGWRPNDHAQVKPEDFEGAKDYVIACAERYLDSRKDAQAFWHYNAIRRWNAVDEKTSIGGLLVEYGRKLAERGDKR